LRQSSSPTLGELLKGPLTVFLLVVRSLKDLGVPRNHVMCGAVEDGIDVNNVFRSLCRVDHDSFLRVVRIQPDTDKAQVAACVHGVCHDSVALNADRKLADITLQPQVARRSPVDYQGIGAQVALECLLVCDDRPAHEESVPYGLSESADFLLHRFVSLVRRNHDDRRFLVADD